MARLPRSLTSKIEIEPSRVWIYKGGLYSIGYFYSVVAEDFPLCLRLGFVRHSLKCCTRFLLYVSRNKIT